MCRQIQIIHVFSIFNKIESDLCFDNGVLTEKYFRKHSNQNDRLRFYNKGLDFSFAFICFFLIFFCKVKFDKQISAISFQVKNLLC